ncbi:hypothetical protein [Spirulina sp. 06S082]|uniref:hypothetical protein n=1 Tax=Spirulina sp. 06S082 TaxID=3110248 RepID=UPI002B20D858|nr:hypothetical protein [Spirulina sp. 06S082]MEA5471916.1 hypothetical protein [Spirulina sp. 06S082]
MNPQGYPFATQDLLGLYTNDTYLELPEGSAIAIRVAEVSGTYTDPETGTTTIYDGFLDAEDDVVIWGSWLEELSFKSSGAVVSGGGGSNVIETAGLMGVQIIEKTGGGKILGELNRQESGSSISYDLLEVGCTMGQIGSITIGYWVLGQKLKVPHRGMADYNPDLKKLQILDAWDMSVLAEFRLLDLMPEGYNSSSYYVDIMTIDTSAYEGKTAALRLINNDEVKMTLYHTRGNAINFNKLKPRDAVFLEISKQIAVKRFDGQIEFFPRNGGDIFDDTSLRNWVTTEIEGLDTTIRNWTTSEIQNLDTSLRGWVTTEIGGLDTTIRDWTTSEIQNLDTSLQAWVTTEIGGLDTTIRAWTTSEIQNLDTSLQAWVLESIAPLVEQKVQEAIATLAAPYLVGEPVFCFSKILGTDMIVSNGGWTWLRGDLWTGSTIGNATSSAYLADNRLEKLYLSWGGTQLDWDNNLPLIFPQIKGRKITVAGQGSGLSDRAIGEKRGEESHVMGIAEMPYHGHGGGNHGHWLRIHRTDNFHGIGAGNVPNMLLSENMGIANVDAYLSGNIINPEGGNQPMNVLDPDISLPLLIFLGVSAI